MARENVFHVEKHANDALHNPPKRGRTHTVREIEAAARALGRATTSDGGDDDGDGDDARDGVAAGDVVVVDGCVVRVDATRKRSTKTARARESRARGERGAGRGWTTTRARGGGQVEDDVARRERRDGGRGGASRGEASDVGTVARSSWEDGATTTDRSSCRREIYASSTVGRSDVWTARRKVRRQSGREIAR